MILALNADWRALVPVYWRTTSKKGDKKPIERRVNFNKRAALGEESKQSKASRAIHSQNYQLKCIANYQPRAREPCSYLPAPFAFVTI
jgi:hypothetical protein